MIKLSQLSMNLILKQMRLNSLLTTASMELIVLKNNKNSTVIEIDNKVNEVKDITEKITLLNELSSELKNYLTKEANNCDEIIEIYKKSNKRYLKQFIIALSAFFINILLLNTTTTDNLLLNVFFYIFLLNLFCFLFFIIKDKIKIKSIKKSNENKIISKIEKEIEGIKEK